MKKLISKKTLSIAMITGLVAVPGLVAAQVVSNDDPANDEVLTTETTQEEILNEDTVTETPVIENTDGTTDETGTDPVVTEEDDDSSVTAAQAQAIAEARFPEKEVARVDTKHEDEGLTYRVRFTDAVKVDVLASDGTIVKIMAENNQSGAHRQDGVNRDSDDDDSADDSSNRGRR